MSKLSFRQFLNYRPMSILAMCGALRDILLGVGFIVGWEQITRTLIYQNYDELSPGISGPAMGVIFILAGLALCVASIKCHRCWMVRALNVQAMAWLFSTLMYCLGGHYILAAIFGVFFMAPAGYKAYYINNNAPLDAQIRDLLGRDWKS